jgi:hypothetical protein
MLTASYQPSDAGVDEQNRTDRIGTGAAAEKSIVRGWRMRRPRSRRM